MFLTCLGRRHGKGTYYFFGTDERYKGYFVKGNREGKGVFTFAFGDVYEGQFKNNKKNGFGILTYSNGDIYEGEW